MEFLCQSCSAALLFSTLGVQSADPQITIISFSDSALDFKQQIVARNDAL